MTLFMLHLSGRIAAQLLERITPALSLITSVLLTIALLSNARTERITFIQQLGTVQGARVPQPWGGKQRQVMVDLDPDAMYARGVSPNDVSTAIGNQNLIIPAGTAKIGATEYNVRLNSSPDLIDAFNDIPVKTVNGIPVYIKDVAHVRRRLRGADQRRPPRRPAGGADDRPQGRGGVHAERGPAGARGAARASRPSCRRS